MKESEEKDPKKGLAMGVHMPPNETIGESLGVYLPKTTMYALGTLEDSEHEFLQSLLQRLHSDMQALQGVEKEEDVKAMMATLRSDLATAPSKLKSLSSYEAYDLVVNMVSAAAASSIRCLFLKLLHEAERPKESLE